MDGLSGDAPTSPAPPSCQCEFLTGLLKEMLRSDNSLPCPLPTGFAGGLLRPDRDGADEHAKLDETLAEGVPSYPLYKHLARTLTEWIKTGTFPRSMAPMAGIAEVGTTEEKIDEWTAKVVELGSHLLQLGEGVGFQLHVEEPYFSQLRGGAKTVEGRCASGAYSKIQGGDILLFNQSLLLRVEEVKRYLTFSEMLEMEGLNNVLPGVSSIAEGLQVYRGFYSEEREQAGVVGIHVQLPEDLRQPYELLFDLLNELRVEGVRALLGMRSTMGSIEDALPPSTSVLLSAFSSLQHET